MLRRSGLVLSIVMVAVAGVGMATEQASYVVEATFEEFELRLYDPQILAETEVATEFDRAGSEAFRRLFAYISGNNAGSRKIKMTAPVSQERVSEEIAMTAPVTRERSGAGWRVAFMVPAKYSWETVPQPLDERVTLRLVPEQLVAAVRFSGGWGEERFVEHERQLREAVADRGYEPAGPEIYARYDPPFKPWFLRRNEVLLPVQPVTGE